MEEPAIHQASQAGHLQQASQAGHLQHASQAGHLQQASQAGHLQGAVLDAMNVVGECACFADFISDMCVHCYPGLKRELC